MFTDAKNSGLSAGCQRGGQSTDGQPPNIPSSRGQSYHGQPGGRQSDLRSADYDTQLNPFDCADTDVINQYSASSPKSDMTKHQLPAAIGHQHAGRDTSS